MREKNERRTPAGEVKEPETVVEVESGVLQATCNKQGQATSIYIRWTRLFGNNRGNEETEFNWAGDKL